MRPTFHLKTLAVAVAAFSVASAASAAGLDRSGQDVTAFFQDGLYAETVYTYIDADVSGFDSSNNNPFDNNYVRGNETGDIAEDYDFFRYGVKADINDTFSIGVLYDEPFGASAEYTGDNNFVANTSPAASAGEFANDPTPTGPLAGAIVGIAEAGTAGENTKVEVRSQSLTGLLGVKLGANKNFQIYGGPVAQRIQADTKLRGLAYGPATGYTNTSNPEMDYGYIAGLAFSKPEIALKAALTYRSEIDHDTQINENYPLATIIGGSGTPPRAIPTNRSDTVRITTPKSINFDFQTGVNPTTLATLKARWVPWSDFVITPPLYREVSTSAARPDGLNLVEYEDDQYQVEVGIAKRLAPALAVSGTVGWDSGAGDPTTSLGPVDGYYSVGLGAKYNFTENWSLSAGGKYLFFGDAQGQLPTGKIVAEFEDNDGFILGAKIAYQAKQGF